MNDLPEWVPLADWADWIALREAMRAPVGDDIQRQAIALLDSYRREGHNPREVLRQSVRRGWIGLHLPK